LGRAVNNDSTDGDKAGMSDPGTSTRPDDKAATGLFRRYLGVAALFAVLAGILGIGWVDWAPVTWTDWLMVIGLTPAGVAGVLIGDRFGLWLKDHGIGRQ
jgi:hypothetical protein